MGLSKGRPSDTPLQNRQLNSAPNLSLGGYMANLNRKVGKDCPRHFNFGFRAAAQHRGTLKKYVYPILALFGLLILLPSTSSAQADREMNLNRGKPEISTLVVFIAG